MTGNRFLSGASMALGTIWGHKLRSFLTVLGVIIGTSTIIGVGSIITGIDGAVTDIFRSFGPNTLIVLKYNIFGASTREEMRRKPLTYENAQAIIERCPAVEYVSPYLLPPGGLHTVKYQGADIYGVELGGTEEGYAENGTEMLYGRFLTDIESLHRRPVVVIGEDVYRGLFPDVDPVGSWIDVDGHMFEVIGVMERPATQLPGTQDLRVLFPYFSMKKMFPNADENMLIVIAREGMLAQAEDEVRAVLRLERRVDYSEPDNFSVTTSEQLIDTFRDITANVALVMIVLSSIGLLVGGIGVMNIMLVSVTERTREIGIRKAVGARRGDIVIQFLTEAVVLTGLGGILGMMTGWIVSLASNIAFPSLPTSVPLWAVAVGFVVSVGIGLFFGIWPASKAARLDPVDALRYE